MTERKMTFVDGNNIKFADFKQDDTDILNDDFFVVIANKSEYDITKYRIIGRANSEVTLQNPIKKNCDSSSCEECKANGHYNVLLVCKQSDKPFSVEIYGKHPTKPSGWIGPMDIKPTTDANATFHCAEKS